ncbi:fungal-specific transcription factor domain protein [Xylaria bambusicola]|uniref:fungal-specific transcription factor domain protein n=1 Tax=Xylaria bambusicola TaxID=326684 RepID=UPI002007C243|nr:fungal-specific transcription factor domain protein [Xylaria bambusicola]KAI0506708.1 fungal-specific transcription factor domain protein [Xylaria bambusicola]
MFPRVRCDRLHPCTSCSSRGLGLSCTYALRPTVYDKPSLGQNHGAAANMQERINQLENLVLGLMHQTTSSFDGQHSRSGLLSAELVSDKTAVAASGTQHDTSPTLSEHGSIRIQHTVISYVSSSHWAAVLDGITDLRNYFAQEEDPHTQASDPVQPLVGFPKPQLFYSGLKCETSASILKSLPSRPVVDRLVSRYFNILDIAPGVVHSGQFLREYEEFWKAPHDTPIMWIGLLFIMMCLSSQLNQSFLSPANTSTSLGPPLVAPQVTEAQITAERYKEQATQCLLLGHYTKGGPYVLETLILYFLIECFHIKSMEIGIWVLVGNMVQIAIHMGYHRDAKHFSNISPFAGEMRRRVWAMIVQLDMSISTQLGLPRLVKESQTTTAEPRNLYDSDFDEHTVELPASRPETEVTPTLYVLAKLRLLSVGVKVADVATEPRLHSYDVIMGLDKQINQARDALPSSLKWGSLASSLNIPSQMIIQRIWLEVIVQQLKIVLHRKFIEPSRLHQQYGRSRFTCISAAMKILELQRLVDEETQTDGLLYQNRWRVSSAFTNDFLLATSILCFCFKAHVDKQKEQLKNSEDVEIETVDMEKIRQLLKASHDIWSRQCDSSREARKATAALRYVLGNSRMRFEPRISEDALPSPLSPETASPFPGFMQEYDFLNFEFENTNEGAIWPVFTSAGNDNVEEGAGVGGSHDMDTLS